MVFVASLRLFAQHFISSNLYELYPIGGRERCRWVVTGGRTGKASVIDWCQRWNFRSRPTTASTSPTTESRQNRNALDSTGPDHTLMLGRELSFPSPDIIPSSLALHTSIPPRPFRLRKFTLSRDPILEPALYLASCSGSTTSHGLGLALLLLHHPFLAISGCKYPQA